MFFHKRKQLLADKGVNSANPGYGQFDGLAIVVIETPCVVGKTVKMPRLMHSQRFNIIAGELGCLQAFSVFVFSELEWLLIAGLDNRADEDKPGKAADSSCPEEEPAHSMAEGSCFLPVAGPVTPVVFVPPLALCCKGVALAPAYGNPRRVPTLPCLNRNGCRVLERELLPDRFVVAVQAIHCVLQ